MDKFILVKKPEMKHEGKMDISVIIPIHNEAANLPQLFEEIIAAMADQQKTYEIIAVNDGSEDESSLVLLALYEKYSNVNIKIINFTRNYGQTAATSCGFYFAVGDIVIPIDADLQNDPKDIPKLVAKIEEGYDVVSGWRKNRKDDLIRVIPSRIANMAINRMIASTKINLHDYGCTLKAYKKDIIKNIKLYGEMHRFIPAFAGWLGAKVGEVEVNHRPRTHGISHYGMNRIWRVILDLIVVRFFIDSLSKPMHFFGKYIVHLIKIFLAGWGLLVVADMHFFPEEINFNTYVILFGFLLLLIQNMIAMGLLGEILIRNYLETLNKDMYAIKEIIIRGGKKTWN